MLKFFVRLAITGGILWLILRKSDFSAVVQTMSDFGPLALLSAAGLYLAIPVLSGMTWCYVIRSMGLGAAHRWAWLTCWIAMFFSQGLPSTMGGDAVRMLRGRQAGLPISASVGSVIVDRLIALVALLTTAVIGWVGSISAANAFAASPLKWAPPVIILGGIAALAVAMSLDRLHGAFLPRRLSEWALVRKIGEVSATLRGSVLSLEWGPRVLLPAIAIHFVRVGVVFFIARVMGLDLSFYDCLAVVPLALLAAMIPITVAGWGLREASFVAAFGVLDVAAADAFSLSVLLGLTIIATSLPGGLIWLLSSREESAVKAL